MFDFSSILQQVFAGVSDLIVNQILTMISGLFTGVFG